MIETLLGSGSPIWTAVPASAFALPGPVSRAVNGPLFGGSSVPGFALGAPNPAPNVSGPGVTGPYGYAGGLLGAAPSMIGPEMMVGVTAPALLAAVAMRRGQPQGPQNDQEVEEFIYDALELLPGTADVEVRCEGGRTTLTGSVQHKRLKRDVGEIAWTIPAVNDVQNNVAVQSRRRARPGAGRETETPPPSTPVRKQG